MSVTVRFSGDRVKARSCAGSQRRPLAELEPMGLPAHGKPGPSGREERRTSARTLEYSGPDQRAGRGLGPGVARRGRDSPAAPAALCGAEHAVGLGSRASGKQHAGHNGLIWGPSEGRQGAYGHPRHGRGWRRRRVHPLTPVTRAIGCVGGSGCREQRKRRGSHYQAARGTKGGRFWKNRFQEGH